ncbi:MAG TPA: HD domain-containing phosphohydrolase [Candidatus Limnocylindrales bacterium]
MNASASVLRATAPRGVSLRERLSPPGAALTILALAILAFEAVFATGGTPNALGHLAYAPIVLAAYVFGWRGGLGAGILLAALLGPIGTILGMPTEGLSGWIVRAVFFVSIGAVTGALYEGVRATADRWRATSERVTASQVEGYLALARGAEAKDTDTGEHIRRVQLSSEALAAAAGLEATTAAQIGWAAMLHDVGKLHVPDRILLKGGRLTREEWLIMRRHAVWGEEILGDGEGFELARRIARSHHENVDGSGYPDGLRGDAIPLGARIVRITDAFDAMTNRRPYSRPRSFEDALEELVRHRGGLFDADLVPLMVRLLDDPAFAGRLRELRPRFEPLPIPDRGLAIVRGGRG